MSINGTANHFIYDAYYYFKDPAAAAGMEFSAAQHRPGVWYRFDWQCAYTHEVLAHLGQCRRKMGQHHCPMRAAASLQMATPRFRRPTH